MAGFSSIENAAAAALMHINRQPKVSRREYIGLVYQDPKSGEFMFTEPQTTGKESSTGGAFDIPKGSLRGIIHNHPKGEKHRERLSIEDVSVADQFGVPSFLGVDDRLMMFDPQTSKRVKKRGIAEDVLAEIPLAMLPQRRVPKVAKR